jgi:2'-5' RNA ligase
VTEGAPRPRNEPAQRTFLALWPPNELQDALASRVAGEIPSSMRAVKARELHVTLVFLGNVSLDLASAVDRSVAPIVAACPRPRLAVRGTGAFGGRGRERLLWAAVENEPVEDEPVVLGALQRDLARACADLGIALEEREWSPHLTVARSGGGRARSHVTDAYFGLDFSLSWIPGGVARVVSRPGAAEAERFTVGALHPFGTDST